MVTNYKTTTAAKNNNSNNNNNNQSHFDKKFPGQKSLIKQTNYGAVHG